MSATRLQFWGAKLPIQTLPTKGKIINAIALSILPSLISGLFVFGLPPWNKEAITLMGMTAFAHFCAFFFADKMAEYSRFTEVPASALANFFLFTLLLIVVILFGRFYYSRPFLLLATGLGAIFVLLNHRPRSLLRLAIIPGGLSDRLLEEIKDKSYSLDDPYDADVIVLDFHSLTPEKARQVAQASLRGLQVLHAGYVWERITGRVPIELSPEEVLIDWKPNKSAYQAVFKRIFDLGIIVLFSPLIIISLLFAALLVYLDLGRPVLFAQKRMGFGGAPFCAYKFRTMRGAPREGFYAGDESERISKLGHLLRKYRLDELPQIWNVVKGEMSIVGPRPEQWVLARKYAEQYPIYFLRHTVRPGLTGWAQVQQGYAEGEEGALIKLSYDLYYVKHMSFWLDIRIIFKTIWILITGLGAK